MPNHEEVQAWDYISLEKLEREILFYPQKFTHWMKLCLPVVIKYFKKDQNALQTSVQTITNPVA